MAAYLNASWGMNYAYTTAQLSHMWAEAVASVYFLALHMELDAAYLLFLSIKTTPTILTISPNPAISNLLVPMAVELLNPI